MRIRNLIVLLLILFLAACAHNTVPLQPGDVYYNSKLKVLKPYVIPPTFWKLGFTFTATDYKAYMKDDHGIFFASPTPVLARDPIIGTVFRTGGLYYQLEPQHKVFYYLVDTSTFAGAVISSEDLKGLSYQLIK